MEEPRRRTFPLRLGWLIGLAGIIGTVAGIILFMRAGGPELPPGMAEERAAAARILDGFRRLPDIDIKPLLELEAKKDYAGAVALMDRALSANASQETLAASLVEASDRLIRRAIQVKPDTIATTAIGAFGALAKLAQAEKVFYADRRRLYEMTRDYYAELEATKSPPIPENLASLVETVNADLEKTKKLNAEFAAAIKAFDAAVAER